MLRSNTRPWLVLAILLAASSLLLGSGETPGPAFVDWKRGIEKQRNAARDARDAAKPGASAAAAVLGSLADDSGYVRDGVFDLLHDAWSEADLVALAGGLLSENLLVAEAVAELYGRRRPAEGLEPLARAVRRSPHDSARALMVWALAEYGANGDEAAAPAIETALSREKSWVVRAEALLALARLRGEAARERIDEALAEKKRLPLRIAALEALRGFDTAGAFAAALTQITDPPRDRKQVWGPRLEIAALDTMARSARAAEGLTAVPRATIVAAVDTLLASLDDATGRGRRARYETLVAITGEDLPFDAAPWRAWWSTMRERWTPGDRGDAAPKKESAGETGVVRFHGIPVDSQRVTFLQDLSGGMSRNLSGEQGGPGPSRLTHAKGELTRVLTALDDRTWANVITFASTYFAAHREPQLLKGARRRMITFCREQEIPTAPGHARGNVYDALAFAATSPYVDTIYLVSEGAPTEGKYHDYDRFLFHFERLNRWTRARVHVLLVGETGGRNRAFLGQLAEGTGGEMRPVEPGE